ncbi:MAG: DUF4091 domain-containing protein [Myxococcales bacterium]|nr:DUF4091 domain-containing protein [Myxococcales bacterium]
MLTYRRLAAAFVALLVPATAFGQIQRIWAVDDGTKVKLSDTSHALAAKNGIFDGSTIKIFGARNETVAFQVIIEGGAAEAANVTVKLDALGDIRDEGTSDNPDSWFVGRRIEIFREHYVEVKSPSYGLVWSPGSKAQPQGLTGMIPDALVPLRASDTFKVPAGANQAVWIDVFIPKGVRPGLHKGTLRVEQDGSPCALPTCQIPIELTVLNAELADEPRAKTMLYFSGGDVDRDAMPARYYADPWAAPQASVQALRDRHYKLARRHRITLFLGKIDAPDEALRRRVSGELFSKAAGYDGPGEGLGQDIYSIHTYGGELDATQAKTWSDWFQQHAPSCLFFLYTYDEPSGGEYALVNGRAKAAEPVNAFVTAKYTSAMPNIDIFAALAQEFSPQNMQQGEAAGKRVWVYNGWRPYAGTFATDDVAISPRVNPWIQYKYNVKRWFFWESTYYNDFQGSGGQVDIYKSALNFTNRLGHKVNGDGLLIYPGRDVLYPSSDQGFEMPLPSIRLKNWRRGIEDVEYMVLAEQAGKGAEAKAIVDELVPKAFRENVGSGDQAPSWPQDGERWLEARRRLAALIDKPAPPDSDGGSAGSDAGGDAGINPGSDGSAVEDGGCCSVDPGAARAPLLIALLLVGALFIARRRRRLRARARTTTASDDR